MKATVGIMTTAKEEKIDSSVARVVAAASLGTVFEWYEFTLYGALASVIVSQFFSGLDPSTGFIFALLTFAVGFIMRPVGAVVFGRVGDRIGRKKTFLITIVIMGVSTVAVGLLPTYESAGLIAPVLLVTLRMLQGLALGGEYGGAATYVAEHSSSRSRGFNTALITGTGTVGLLLAFGVILASRTLTGDDFDVWGWRVPFLFSLLLLIVSLVIRMKMEESPAFQKMKNEKRISCSPLRETFTEWVNIKRLFIAFFGVCGGMTCAYYVAALYPTFFLTQNLKVDPQQASSTLTLALICALPVFLFAGWLSDRIGRKPVLLIGLAVSALAIFPIYKGISLYANPDLVAAQEHTPITLVVDPASCSFMFNPTGTRTFTGACDLAKQALAGVGVSYITQAATGSPDALINIGSNSIPSYNASGLSADDVAKRSGELRVQLRRSLAEAGYPLKADPAKFDRTRVFLLLVLLTFCGVFTATPVAPMLVEMFPVRIRYTSMSFPYHLASGWVGGLLPTIAFAMSVQSGNIYFGLWYPVGWIALSFVVALFLVKETYRVDINL